VDPSLAARAGRETLEQTSPGFFASIHIHMTEPYQRLIAKHWIEVIVKTTADVGSRNSGQSLRV